ncbi:MAG: type ISP restriction/modification enzyme [Planctomycetota bacterium]
MTNRDAERLRRINAFPQLVAYLRDELQWPFVDFDDPEEIAFDWSAEELGIEGKHAAAIEEIRQLQPPEGDWPWGIFYVKFEKKRLPITILRRALASVVKKKRATANTGQRWNLEDLLFISSYGEGEKRQISFARFQAPEEAGSRLPVLKVLAWDEDDTDLSLEHTAGELRAKLVWPDDTSDVAAWRSQWGSAFTRGHRETIDSSKDLARELAGLAQRIRDRITQVLSLENDAGPLRGLMEAFRGSLVHDLDEPGFADMYAQTIAYGLFSARVTNPEGRDAGSLLSVPVTNPFLKELLGTFLEVGGRDNGGPGIDFDELGVNDVVDLLDDTDMEAVLRDFGDKNPLEDPVIHFFEGFLGEYDKKIKKDRGVFYTPRPVVSFIVRSVDELLRTEFGLEDGLADTTTWGEMVGRIDDLEIPEGATDTQAFVQILDPATGTGTFLVEVIDLIHRTMTAKWQDEGHPKKEILELWNDYVPEDLLPRLHGYELMMAPYAIAHMKIGLKLHETGYRFESDERARIYLTNALEPAQDFSGTLAFAIPALAHEATAVNAIKRGQRFTVVIGNPPYSNFGQLNQVPSMLVLLEDYKKDLEEKKLNLDDDYIKFLRYSQWLLEASGAGAHGMITNNSYLEGVTHRQMRKVLCGAFNRVDITDLHGNSNKKERCPDGSEDNNVFDIRAGVGVMVSGIVPGKQPAVMKGLDIWGSRTSKYSLLSRHAAQVAMDYEPLNPESPFYFFSARDRSSSSEYECWLSLRDIFLVSGNGVKSERDAVSIHFSKEEVEASVSAFRRMGVDELREEFNLWKDSRDWTVEKAKADVMEHPGDHLYRKILYRPFDYRWTWYSGKSRGFIGTPGIKTMRYMSPGNVALVTTRQTADKFDVLCSEALVGHKSVAAYDINTAFPLYADPGNANTLFGNGAEGHRCASNLNPRYTSLLSEAAGEDVVGSPHRAFAYMYGVLCSPNYRDRYAESLKVDFARIPLPGNPALYRAIAECGMRLIDLHLCRGSSGFGDLCQRVGEGTFCVESASYSDDTVWLDKAKTRGFKRVPEEVWNFHIGGYQVCEKWLKDRQAKGGKNPRPGRVLTDEDIEHYQKIVVALAETIRIMAEIDEVIEAHGGWPGAFVTDTGSEAGDVKLGGASLAADAPAE